MICTDYRAAFKNAFSAGLRPLFSSTSLTA